MARRFDWIAPFLMIVLVFSSGCGRSANSSPDSTAPPRVIAPSTTFSWRRPGPTDPPVWGPKNGLAVGLWPTNGPRGLIRVYAPYLGQEFPRMVNFISIEPVVWGVRGQSELETGTQSGRQGLAMWSADTIESATEAKGHDSPAPGVISREADRETLTFYIGIEPFRNGARPILEVLFRSDRPHEVGFRLHSASGGKPMDSCVLSATMGNYGRLRRLWLRDEVIAPEGLWQKPVFDKLGFLPWKSWGRARLFQTGGQVLVAATSDEIDPAAARYDSSVPAHWRYEGKPATHYWRGPDTPGVVVRVNARTHYWGNGGPIPGGVAYENFELEAPFQEGQEFWFGITEEKPAGLGFDTPPRKPVQEE